MPLTTGAHLGPYEIVSALGAGGMGEVYRARDPRLGRDVAVKVLPAAFSSDPDRLARFEHEARAAAALNHPNILAVYDIGRHDEAPYIVSELLEGETLRERLSSGELPVRKAIEHAVQIARGLAAAHDKGIIHRDLKPENVFVTTDGRLKILDFGLAKLTEAKPAASALSAVPTALADTQAGVVLGTLGYMSPEQVRGLPADHRSDIFALGALLYEMLSGRRAFQGDTTIDAMTAILKDDPPDLPAAVRQIPPALERIVDRCLEKNPASRFKSVDDLAFALDALSAHSGPVETLAAEGSQPTRWERVLWASGVALFALVAAATTWRTFGARLPTAAAERHVEISTPPTYDHVSFAISPDGEKIVFVAASDRRPQLWIRSLATGSVRSLPDTDGASFPFWSPDSRSIGFFNGDDLVRVDVDGGNRRVVAGAPVGAGGSWNSEGVIVYTPVPDAPVMRVAASGGPRSPLSRTEESQGGERFPQFLPDGRHFLYYRAETDRRGVYLGSLDSPERERLLDADAAAVFVPPSALLFVRAGTLFAQRFDPDRRAAVGSPTPLTDGVSIDPYGAAAVSASESAIVYRLGSSNRQRQLVWFDRSGKELGTASEVDPASPLNIALSPDERMVALNRSVNGNSDLWLLELGRGVLSRFTSELTPDISPVWSPMGDRIAYGGQVPMQPGFNIYHRPTGAGGDRAILGSSRNMIPADWSGDGRHILYITQDASQGWDVGAFPMTGDGEPFPVAQSPGDQRSPKFSPDDRWIALESNESGREEIYVQPFPGPGVRMIVSTSGGLQPQWAPDGKELFYVARDGRLMSVALRFAADGKSVAPASPVPLFPARVGSTRLGGSTQSYNVMRDGRFLMNVLIEQTASPLTVILNWKPRGT
jgi:serine/threonine protein kinase/Tol biopolymer transport system component